MSQLKSGLVSVSFRKLNPPQITALCREAGLAGIEWGGDQHVPHGDIEIARRVRELTADAGLEVAAYGSYYRVGASEQDGLAFGKVLDTARALGAPLIRVWAGVKDSAKADAAYFNWVSDEALRIAAMAAEVGIKVAFEYHGGTLNDNREASVKLLQRSAHPNLFTLWQPPNGMDLTVCLESLEAAIPRLQNVHVFHWWPQAENRHPLEDGLERWQPYMDRLRRVEGERYCLLEFIKDDDIEQLRRDAATLNALLK